MSTKRRIVHQREALAMLEGVVIGGRLDGGRRAMFWDCYSSIPQNVRIGSVAVVNIMGALDHHDGGWCDSYESIVARCEKALSGEDVVEQAQARARWSGGDLSGIPAAVTPSHIVLRIDSPGGLVSGLNQAVFKLRAMAAEAGIPIVAYCNELAASAAYALACACDEIVLPESGIVGSVGVISCLFDQTDADKRMGVNVVTIASGDRKTDGHPHVAISDAAVAAEQKRVDAMAGQFFDLVAQARPLTAKAVEGFEAAIFMGDEAVSAGLADACMSWDELLETLLEAAVNQKQVANLGQPESTSTGASRANRVKAKTMSIAALSNLIKKTEAAFNAATGPAKKRLGIALAAHRASLAAFKASTADFKKTKEKYEKTTSEETGSPEESAEDEAAASGDDEPDGDEDGEADDDDDGDGEEAASAVLAIAEQATGRKGKRVVGALASLVASAKLNADRIAKLEAKDRASELASLIADAKAARRITPHEAKTLATKALPFVRDYLSMRTGAVVTGDETITMPDPTKVAPTGDAAAEASLPAEVVKQIDLAVRQIPGKAQKATVRASLVKAHNDRMAAANASGGRY